MGLLFRILFLPLVLFAHVSTAQSHFPPPPTASFGRMVSIMIPLLISFLLVLAFLVVCVRILMKRNQPAGLQVSQLARHDSDCFTGLESAVLEGFPTFAFSEVKLQTRGALECAVCLSDFESGETLRLITGCRHVFHAECIDKWFLLHATCPVCRANLNCTCAAAKKLDEERVGEIRVSVVDLVAGIQAPPAGQQPAVRQFRGILLSRCNTTGHSSVPRDSPECVNASDARVHPINSSRIGRSVSNLVFPTICDDDSTD